MSEENFANSQQPPVVSGAPVPPVPAKPVEPPVLQPAGTYDSATQVTPQSAQPDVPSAEAPSLPKTVDGGIVLGAAPSEPVPQQPSVSEPPASQAPMQTQPSPAPQAPKKKSNSAALYGIIAGVVCALIAIGVIYFFMNQKPKDAAADNKATPAVVDTTATKVASAPAANTVTEKEMRNNTLGKYRYTGPVDDEGQPNGAGEAVFIKNDGSPDGRSYKGPFVHGTLEGTDAEFKLDGDVFKGSLKANMFDTGTYTKDDGTYFTGDFVGGNPSSGKWYDASGKVLQEL